MIINPRVIEDMLRGTYTLAPENKIYSVRLFVEASNIDDISLRYPSEGHGELEHEGYKPGGKKFTMFSKETKSNFQPFWN